MPESPRPTPPAPFPSEAGSAPTIVRARNHVTPALALGDAPPGPSGSLVGLKLGEYDVISELGAGGMGIVYRGVQPQIGKTVAIKVLKPEIASGTDSVQALLAEARAVNSIHHPGIVDIFSFGSTPDGRPYVVMELLEGESLDAVLQSQGRFQPLEAIEVLNQMLSALDAAHSAGVIHRDLKPANIHLSQLKDGGWQVKLLDFGLAKLTAPGSSSAPQTQANVVRGTPEYMSPEQARAQDVSPRTDLYAIGVVAFELLTGQLPFKASNPVELLMQHISAQPPVPSSLEPTIPPAFEALILELLAKEPEARPESALRVRRELLKIKKQLIEGGTQVRHRPRNPPKPRTSGLRPALVPPADPPTEQPLPVKSSSTRLVVGLGMVILTLVAALVALQQPPAVIAEPEVVNRAPPNPTPMTPTVVEPEVMKPPEEAKVDPTPLPLVRPAAPVRPKARLHTVDDVKKLLAELDAEANQRPPGEARSRKRALDEFREELNSGGKPEVLWRQLKEYERNSQ